MKKLHLIILLGIVSSFFSCEVDDICVEPTTPQLIIRFYDVANPTQKKVVDNLSIWIAGKDSIVKKLKTDSIAIPLKTDADLTLYKFSSTNLVDEISYSYQRKEVFVSRSCGFKTEFLNFTATKPTSNWVKQLKIIKPTIENEKNAHIHILH